MSAIQRRCVIEATIDPLIAFRRGFARSKEGPFYPLATVRALVQSGALRAYHPRRGRRGLHVSARAS
jgi:hypothetical protein